MNPLIDTDTMENTKDFFNIWAKVCDFFENTLNWPMWLSGLISAFIAIICVVGLSLLIKILWNRIRND